jgi:hypothetical protein
MAQIWNAMRSNTETMVLLAVLLLSVCVLSSTSSAADSPKPRAKVLTADLTLVGMTDGIESSCQAKTRNEEFYRSTFKFTYSGQGRIILAGSDDGTLPTLVDDRLDLAVQPPSGPARTFDHDYSNKCTQTKAELPPQDVTNLFTAGVNTVILRLNTQCGVCVSSTPLWLSIQGD